jgi:hypothetical protein
MKVNVLGLVGAVIGVVAIFSTWLGYASGWFHGAVSWNLIDILNDAPAYHNAWYAALFFIVGTLVAFLSPAGGLLQVAGVLFWWTYYLDYRGEMPSRMASYIGLASAIIVLASMLRPLGLGLMKGPFGLKDRLLIFRAGRPSEQKEESAASLPTDASKGDAGFCAHCGKPLIPGEGYCPGCGRSSQK